MHLCRLSPDWDYIQPMLSRSPSGYPEKQMITHNITQVAVNFAEYSYAQMWWDPEKQPDDSDVATPSKGRKAVIWLHPYSYQNGYHADYAQGATAMYERLAKAGYVVIAFDQVGFGLRTLQGTRFYQRYPRWSKLGRMVRDVSSAVDVLLSDQNDYTLATHPSGLPVGKYMATDWPAIDPKHIYVAGYALGGLVSLYANALEPRLAGAASIAGISPLRSQENAHRTGGNDLISKWHSIQPRLGWYEGVEGAKIPYDYDDVIAVAKKPTLVIAPEADRTADHPALLALLARAKLKLGSNDGLLSVNTTSYEPPMPNPTGSHASPAVGINRLDNAHQSTLVEWLDWVSSPKL
jgi:dienelactone hydrolase